MPAIRDPGPSGGSPATGSVTHSAHPRAGTGGTKLELLAAWLPGRRWYAGPAGAVLLVATYRFDDPAGAVGIETMLVRVGDGPIHQVPLTYREAPLPGGDGWLLGTSEHSVLGRRWIYDGSGDPVYAAALAGAILGNTGQAEQLVQVEGELKRRESTMSIASSAAAGAPVPAVGAIQRVVDGDPTLIVTDTVELAILRRVEAGTDHTGAVLSGTNRTGAAPTGADRTGAVLSGTWPGQATPIALASATHAA